MSKSTDTFERLTQRADEVTLKNRAMDEAPFGITLADLTQEDEPLVYANDGFERITGYPADEIVGRNCRFLQGEDTDPAAVTRMREAIENRSSVQVELLNYRKDGTPFWNEVTLAPIPDDGDVRYYVGFQQDISKRKEYANKLKEQRDGLDVLNQMVRHDIRNDLQLVLGSVEMLRDHVDDAGASHLETVLESARQAVELTETAREIAEVLLRSEADHEPIPLRSVLSQEIDDASSAYPDATITMEGSIPDVPILADDMLGSIFRNLLKNAVQHNDEPEPIITVSATATDETATVHVEDNGPGIPDDRKETVFERGEKGADSAGTGIGLSLVSSLVEKYGGDVYFEDRAPKGARCVVKLPIAG